MVITTYAANFEDRIFGKRGIKMKTSDFFFDLPKELIAQDPLEDRSASLSDSGFYPAIYG